MSKAKPRRIKNNNKSNNIEIIKAYGNNSNASKECLFEKAGGGEES